MLVLGEANMHLQSAFLFMFALNSLICYQVPRSIWGHVVDSSGEPLSGVEVILENVNMELKRSHTDREGIYHFDCLEKGTYSLTFKMGGFITERLGDFTYEPPNSYELNGELEVAPSTADFFTFPASSPAKGLVVIVRDNRSSDYLENARVEISSGNAFHKESANTNVCGNATIFLDPGEKYSVRISKDGFQEQLINLDMPSEPKQLDVRLNPLK